MKIVNTATAFSEGSRRKLLSDYFAAYERLVESDLAGRDDPEAVEAVSRLWDAYLKGLPVVELSRNPFSGEVFCRTVDFYGLDGLWWNSENPARPMEPLKVNEVAFTGAVSLVQPVERGPFLCKPGPGVPFVVPRILNQDGVQAVIRSLPVGSHQGYAIVYFAQNELKALEGFGDWGRTFAYYAIGEEDFGWQEWVPAPSDFDYDLLPWIQSGKLLWIAPEDDDLSLSRGLDCPYLTAKGNRFFQVVSKGKVWEDHLFEPAEEFDEYEPIEGAEAEAAHQPAEQPVPSTQEPVAPPVQQTRYCRQCGGPLKPIARFCPKCGTPVNKPAPGTGSDQGNRTDDKGMG